MRFHKIVFIAGLVGLAGGFLFGIWDGLVVFYEHLRGGLAFIDIISLVLYSVSIYAVAGGLVLAIIGVAVAGIIRSANYKPGSGQLASIFIGIFTLLMTSFLFADKLLYENIAHQIEITIIGIFTGIGIASCSVYILNKGIARERVIAVGISLLVSMMFLFLMVTWTGFTLGSGGRLFTPIHLLAQFGILVASCMLAIVLYRLILSAQRKFNYRRQINLARISVGILASVFIVISIIGPLNPDSSTAIKSLSDNTAPVPSAAGKPNILWIVMDTARADHFSCYGYYRNTSPNIDRIASEGVLFENAIANAPWTLPSHASMFTGAFVSRHGADAQHK